MKKMGLLVRFASVLAVSQVVYQTTPGSPTASGVGVVSCSGRAPRDEASWVTATNSEKVNNAYFIRV